jgi:hypothetical protein
LWNQKFHFCVHKTHHHYHHHHPCKTQFNIITKLSTVEAAQHLSFITCELYSRLLSPFLGEFSELRKATISFVMSVRPSVRKEQLGCHWRDLHEIWYLCVFRKLSRKFKIH